MVSSKNTLKSWISWPRHIEVCERRLALQCTRCNLPMQGISCREVPAPRRREATQQNPQVLAAKVSQLCLAHVQEIPSHSIRCSQNGYSHSIVQSLDPMEKQYWSCVVFDHPSESFSCRHHLVASHGFTMLHIPWRLVNSRGIWFTLKSCCGTTLADASLPWPHQHPEFFHFHIHTI
jgi:hypothetical protein